MNSRAVLTSCIPAVHKDSRPETKERSLWREDKVQLEVQLLYTYVSSFYYIYPRFHQRRSYYFP